MIPVNQGPFAQRFNALKQQLEDLEIDCPHCPERMKLILRPKQESRRISKKEAVVVLTLKPSYWFCNTCGFMVTQTYVEHLLESK